MKSTRILVVDDEKNIRLSLSSLLIEEGYEVTHAQDGKSALHRLEKETPDIILLDVWLPDIDGLELLKEIKIKNPSSSIIMMSGHGTIETAVRATKLGVFDFIEKPLSLDKLLLTIKNLISILKLEEENRVLRQKVAFKYEMVAHGDLMCNLKKQMEISAPTHSWILITGENGTGKELVARNIHDMSLRNQKPFIEVNCAAIPEELIESELFGHEKGAFTGAMAAKRGKFEMAHEGTLFLDEVGDMSLKTQAKILRVLQEKKFERVGGTTTYEVDVRVIGATNKNLEEEIKNGKFREDLFYRLNVIPIYVPPLRDRREEIPYLVNYFLQRISEENGKKQKVISEEAMRTLINYDWPGNVRELKNMVERLFIMTQSQEIEIEDIPILIQEDGDDNDGKKDYKAAKMRFEKEYIERKLKEFEGNISKTAKAIGVERSNLHRKIRTYDIEV